MQNIKSGALEITTQEAVLFSDISSAISAQEKGEILVLHLSNVFKLHSNLPDISPLEQVKQYISSPLPPVKHIFSNEVSSIIKTLKTNKSPGHDKISNKIVKYLIRNCAIFRLDLAHQPTLQI